MAGGDRNGQLAELDPVRPAVGVPPEPRRSRAQQQCCRRRGVREADGVGQPAALRRPTLLVVRGLVRGQVLAATGPLTLSPFVLAELDYLIGKLAGGNAQLAMLDEVARGVYDLATFSAHEVGLAREITRKYRDLQVGLADASILVLARRLSGEVVLTLDERRFRVLAAEQPLRLLPADR